MRPTDFLYQSTVSLRYCIQVYKIIGDPSCDFVNFASSHQTIEEERKLSGLRIRDGASEDGLAGASSILDG